LELPVAAEVYYLTEKSNREFFDNRLYIWDSIDFACATSIMLASEENGKLKDFFEKEFDNRWTENQLVKECTYDDSRFDLWMEHLEKATSDHLLDWRGYEHHFSTRYDNTDIEIEIDMNSSGDDCAYLYVRNQAGGLGIRFGHKTIETISFKEFVEKSYNSSLNNKEEENANKKEKAEPRYISKSGLRIIALARQIEKQIEYRKDNNLYSGLTKREIKHTDVIVTTQSMICHKKQHMITPLRGIVQLLTTQNEQVSYEIYVGFCVECNHYYVFKSDFDEMIKIGKPLCAVYQESIDGDEKQTYGSFRYKSQSVLNAMGYTVGMNDDLSATERQEILSKALQSKLIEIHDLLKFLNWLIRTRETQIKYRTAVSKWKEDVKFVEEYEKDMRDEIIVDSITVK
jgi:hypothetical protein